MKSCEVDGNLKGINLAKFTTSCFNLQYMKNHAVKVMREELDKNFISSRRSR